MAVSVFESPLEQLPASYHSRDPLLAARRAQLTGLEGLELGGEDGEGEEVGGDGFQWHTGGRVERGRRVGGHAGRGRGGGSVAADRSRPQPHTQAFEAMQARRQERILGAQRQQPCQQQRRSQRVPPAGGYAATGPAGGGGSLGGGLSGGGSEGVAPRPPPFVPSPAQLQGLVSALRREVVHHTGVGPLYGAVLGMVGEAALRRAAAGLDGALWAYGQQVGAAAAGRTWKGVAGDRTGEDRGTRCGGYGGRS